MTINQRINTLVLLLCLFCASCEYKRVNGQKYKLIRKSTTNSDGSVNVELWQKNGVTNYYYTPSLTGNDMIPIMR